MRNFIALTLVLAGCAGNPSTVQTQGLKQNCVTVITCPDGGVLLQSVDVSSSDSNDYDAGTAVFVPPGGSSGGTGPCGPEIYTCYDNDGGTSSGSGGSTGGSGGSTGGPGNSGGN